MRLEVGAVPPGRFGRLSVTASNVIGPMHASRNAPTPMPARAERNTPALRGEQQREALLCDRIGVLLVRIDDRRCCRSPPAMLRRPVAAPDIQPTCIRSFCVDAAFVSFVDDFFIACRFAPRSRLAPIRRPGVEPEERLDTLMDRCGQIVVTADVTESCASTAINCAGVKDCMS